MDIRPNNNNQMGGMSSGVNNTNQMPIKKEKSIGPMIAILIVVLAIIIAAIYFIGAKFSSPKIDTTNTTSQTINTETQTAATIKADDVDTLNQELDSQLKDIDFSF
jgi:biopolymer transport protein ExbD